MYSKDLYQNVKLAVLGLLSAIVAKGHFLKARFNYALRTYNERWVHSDLFIRSLRDSEIMYATRKKDAYAICE